jgi:precorrin-6x reductase
MPTNKKPVFWVIAGTSDGRRLVEELCGCEAFIHVSLATDYGKWFMEERDNSMIHVGRLSREEMKCLIRDHQEDCVIDTTHPFAREVTNNISSVCRETNTKYLRLLRPLSGGDDVSGRNATFARDTEHAVRLLAGITGKIFVTCGSKEIQKFTIIPDFSERVYIRILPEPQNLQRCMDLGFKPPNIICMQGPFSKELNIAMLRSTGAAVLVTKDSGPAGGFSEKMEAAAELGIPAIVIGRPLEAGGLTHDQILGELREQYL